MTRRRKAIVTAGLAAGAVAGGMVGRTVLNARRRRDDPSGDGPFMDVPDEFNRLVDGFAREVLKAGGRRRRAA